MDLPQQCQYCSKRHSYISANITHLRCDLKEGIVDISAKPLPADSFASQHGGILLPFGHQLDHDPFNHPSNNTYSDTNAASENLSVNAEQPPVWSNSHGTPHLDNRRDSKPLSNKNFDIFDNGIGPW